MYDEKCLLRIGSNIKLLRSVRQLNQHQLAERLGISQTHLSQGLFSRPSQRFEKGI